MQRTFHTPAIILKKKPIAETNLIVTFYSPFLGKIIAVAKGARKINSRWSGHLEPLNICQLQLHKSPARFTITQCQTQRSFKNILKNLEKLTAALLILEFFQKSVWSAEHGLEFFTLLEETLRRLNSFRQHLVIMESFKLKLLQLIGTLPNLTACPSCHKRWNASAQILLDNDGHFSCSQCQKTPHEPYRKIDFAVIKLANHLLEDKIPESTKIIFSIAQKQQLQGITSIFMEKTFA